MTIQDFAAASMTAFSLILIGSALAGKSKFPVPGRVWFAACFVLAAVGAFTSPSRWGRFLGVEALVTIYVLLVPILPWHRNSESKKVATP